MFARGQRSSPKLSQESQDHSVQRHKLLALALALALPGPSPSRAANLFQPMSTFFSSSKLRSSRKESTTISEKMFTMLRARPLSGCD